MVHSYKGGSGKTLISTNMASIFSKQGKKVLLIEADLDGPVFVNVFDDIDPDVYTNQYLKERDKTIDHYIYQTKHGFDAIFASPNFQIDDIINVSEYEGLLEKIIEIKKELLKTDYDYVIWDLSPGINYIAIAMVLLATDIIIMMRPDTNSLKGTKILLDRIYANILDLRKKNLYLIINQIPHYVKFNRLMEQWTIMLRESFDFIDDIVLLPFNNLINYNLATGNDILKDDSQTEIAVNARHRPMKLWYFTAIGS